jgi:hypothetical protein
MTRQVAVVMPLRRKLGVKQKFYLGEQNMFFGVQLHCLFWLSVNAKSIKQ